MSGDGPIFKLVALLRTAFLCLAFTVGLLPQDAEAHAASAGSVAIAKMQIVAGIDNGEDHSLAEKTFGQCHPAIDCAPAALVLDPMGAHQLDHAATVRFIHFPLTRHGFGPGFEPPPPRSFT